MIFFRAVQKAVYAMRYATQDEVDSAFAALDSLLDVRSATPFGVCRGCGLSVFDRGANPGSNQSFYDVCRNCGAVDGSSFGMGAQWGGAACASSNYKRIHHWHERVSQLLLLESAIPHAHFLQIAERLLDGSHSFVNKDVIRSVLRSLNMQMYIEKWLQIIQRLTGIEPPKPGAQLLNMLDQSFMELQEPFNVCKVEGRKNFLNYNYVFCRLLQRLKCAQFCMFFPLIKSRQKLRALDGMWLKMATHLNWEVTPLQPVSQFAVKLERPELLLAKIRQQVEQQALVVTSTAPTKTGFRKSDQRLLHELDRQKRPRPRRSNQPEPELQRLGTSVKRPRRGGARAPLRLLR